MSDITPDNLESFVPFATSTSRQRARAAQASVSASHQADLRECAAAIRKGSKSFHLASLILPAETRKAALSLYAFCRHSDDLIDDPRADRTALEQLKNRLDLVYRGTPAPYACDRAFARTVQAYGIPKCVPDALLDGFAMDLGERHYKTIAQVKDYATCVAATVGLMMSLVMRVGDKDALARAADLGIAMQLTNIARDVGEDARNGRLYLPEDWMRDAGLDPEAFLASPKFSPELREVVLRLLAEAAHHYKLGHAGIAALPENCRHAIRTAALVYQEIGTEIAVNNYDSVTRRAHTRKIKKLSLLLKARLPQSEQSNAAHLNMRRPADPSAAHLVSACANSFETHARLRKAANASVADDSNMEWVLGVMIKLQAESRAHHRSQKLALQRRPQNRF
ncbi:MAG: phytoene/squalene synthase family protein [Labrenzia sp.]